MQIKKPCTSKDWKDYYNLRWRILRKPLGLNEGAEIDDELEDKAVHRMIKVENKVVGVGRLHFIDNNIAQIRYMAIDHNFRGRGFGKVILDEFIKISKTENIEKVILYARESVLGFYEKLGFSIVKKAHRLVNIQHFLMERTNNY